MVNPHGNKSITVSRFKEVARLSDGASFGELALLKNEGRAATVVCSKMTRFATLNRRDYVWTIGQEEKRKLKQIVAFFRSFRIFSTLRANVIEKVFKYMKSKKFLRGQKVYREGVSEIDGLYFITSGEFEITQSVDSDKTKAELKVAKRALSRTQIDTKTKGSNLTLTKQTRSQIMLQKISSGATKTDGRESVTILRLVILGQNELFGLEEIMENLNFRSKTVECISTRGTCYYLSKEYFIHCVNQFKFSQQVIQEQIVKHQLYIDRMSQTHEFHQRFIKQQQDMLNMLLARDKVREDDALQKKLLLEKKMNMMSS